MTTLQLPHEALTTSFVDNEAFYLSIYIVDGFEIPKIYQITFQGLLSRLK